MICSTCRDRLDGVEAFASGMKDAFGSNSAIAISKQTRSFCLAAVAQGFARIGLPCSGRHYFHIFAGAQTQFAPVANLQLDATRGEMPMAAPARELDLTLLNAPTEGQGFRAVIVNATGRTVWSGSGPACSRKSSSQSAAALRARRLLPPPLRRIRRRDARIRFPHSAITPSASPLYCRSS